jgi:hypothetical protein
VAGEPTPRLNMSSAPYAPRAGRSVPLIGHLYPELEVHGFETPIPASGAGGRLVNGGSGSEFMAAERRLSEAGSGPVELGFFGVQVEGLAVD